MVDLRQAPEIVDLTMRTEKFIRTVVQPFEERDDGVIANGGEELRKDLQAAAREAGVFAPHVSRDLGGAGLGMVERMPVFEAAGLSLFGPLALNIAAPDEGNVHLLLAIATPDQRDKYLRPLAAGQIRSAFAMTEPAPGAGSDPVALATTARRDGSCWRIDGRKHFITGADGAKFLIVMARTSGRPGDAGGATMLLVDADNPGVTVRRHIRTLDSSMIGGHCVVEFDACRVARDAVLGEVDAGFQYAQVRLGPARMTHCMRWLGSARRAQAIALEWAASRSAFGARLADLGMTQQLLADNEIDLAAARGLVLQACWELDQGERAGHATAIAKTFTAEAVWRVVDRSVQVCGGLGVSEYLPLARLLREVRPFRVYDGPSEVHRWSIARRAVRRVAAS